MKPSHSIWNSHVCVSTCSYISVWTVTHINNLLKSFASVCMRLHLNVCCVFVLCVYPRGEFLAIWALLSVSVKDSQYFVICYSLSRETHIDVYLIQTVINELSAQYWAIGCVFPVFCLGPHSVKLIEAQNLHIKIKCFLKNLWIYYIPPF